ncbi:MAG TPA: Uma2 family endonuclease [Isosphaeraceae bacterium]|jgi:Uma2 family endonuclease|nr:Uma2 family endonuclease [Isosphaeraceae bacterium]
MSSAAIRARCTPEEYLVHERRAQFRHEYRDGVITAMAGTSREHSLIAWNIGGELRQQLRGRPCEAYIGEMRVGVDPAGLYTYPDITVVCGGPRFLDDRFDTLVNPDVLVEILSPSTEADDRGEEFARSRRLDSLRDYVLVAQDRVRVERSTRRGDEWVLTEFNSLDDILRLESIDCSIPLREIYDKVPLPDREPPADA